MGVKMIKKIYFYFLAIATILLTQGLRSEITSISYQILNFDLKGVCKNSKAVIVYGNLDNYLISNDLGNTWKQIPIKGFINKILEYGDTFYALVDSAFIIVSPEGTNWEEIQIPMIGKYTDIAFDSAFVFLLSNDNKVVVLDHNYNIVRSINFENKLTTFFPFNGFLLVGTSNGMVYICNPQSGEVLKQFDISSLGKRIHHFMIDSGKVFFLCDTKLFSISSNLEQPELVVDVPQGNYNVKNGEIYTLTSEIIYLYNKHRTKWVGFFQLDNSTKEFKRLNYDILTRFIDDSLFADFLPPGKLEFNFVTDSIIIAVSTNKTLLISKDKGRNWELVSYFPYPLNEIFVQDKYLWGLKWRSIFRSSDFGVTWLPQKADSLFIKYLSSINFSVLVFFDKSGKGFVVNNIVFHYPDSSKNFDILFSDDFGETYRNGMNDNLYFLQFKVGDYPPLELLRFKNGFVVNTVEWNNILRRKTPFSSVSFFDMNFNQVWWRGFNDTILYRTFLTDNFDTLYGIFVKATISDTAFFFLKDVSYWIGYTTNGYSWSKLFDLDINEFYQGVLGSTSNGFICYRDNVYESSVREMKILFIDVKGRKTNLILNKYFTKEEPERKLAQILVLSYIYNKIFYADDIDSVVYVYDFIETTPGWKRTKVFDEILKKFNFNLSNLIPATDSIFYLNLTKNYFARAIIKNGGPSKVENSSTEGGLVLNKLFIQTLPPFPQPASSFVKAKIYIEGFREIKPEYFKIYDLSGNEITYRIETNVEKLSPFLFEVSFEVSGLPNGIYFIRYAQAEEALSLPVMIYR